MMLGDFPYNFVTHNMCPGHVAVLDLWIHYCRQPNSDNRALVLNASLKLQNSFS